jgi:hypothetical protein
MPSSAYPDLETFLAADATAPITGKLSTSDIATLVLEEQSNSDLTPQTARSPSPPPPPPVTLSEAKDAHRTLARYFREHALNAEISVALHTIDQKLHRICLGSQKQLTLDDFGKSFGKRKRKVPRLTELFLPEDDDAAIQHADPGNEVESASSSESSEKESSQDQEKAAAVEESSVCDEEDDW